MLSGTITLHSSQFQTGTPLVIELLDGELNRCWQGTAIVNMPAPFPAHLATEGSVIFIALPSGRAQVQLKRTAGAPDRVIDVVLPPLPERMSAAGEGRSPSDRTLDDVWIRLWSRDAARAWRVRRWKPVFHPGAGRMVSGEFNAHDLRLGQHYLQMGVGSSQPRMTAVPAGGATFTLRPVSRRGDGAAGMAIDIDVGAGSPAAQIMLSYLSNGDLERAQIVGDTLLLAHSDRLDLTTAVLGGYYLLACRDMDRLESLLTTSLSKWAGWLPDNHVIAGWRCLCQEPPAAEEARQHLLNAARCGLPIFTHGLRLMVDGLRMIEADEALCNDAVRKTGERLRKFASVANWRSTFTAFSAAHPNKPINPGASIRWLTEARRAISDPLSCFPWASEPPRGQASRDEFGGHISAAFNRAFASPPGNVGAAEAYKAFNEGITNLCEATP